MIGVVELLEGYLVWYASDDRDHLMATYRTSGDARAWGTCLKNNYILKMICV